MSPPAPASPDVSLFGTLFGALRKAVLVTEAAPLDEPGPRIVYANAAFEQLTGWRPDEVIGRSPRFLQHPEMNQATRSQLRSGLERGEPVSVEILNRHRDGTPYWVALDITPLALGGTSLFVALQRDTSAARHEVERLRALEERMRVVLGATSDGYLDWDLRTDRLVLSESLRVYLGLASAGPPLRVDQFLRLLHPDDVESFRRATQTARYPGGAQFRVECRARSGSAGERWLLIRGAVVQRDPDGTATRLVAIGVNITAQHESASEMRAMDSQMQVAQRLDSLGLLAGGIAHDFNNLLVGVLGNASHLLAILPPESDVAAAVREIETAAERAADLTRQLLAYSGRGRFVEEPVDLSTIVRQGLAAVRERLHPNALVHLDLAEHLPLTRGDAVRLQQVVMNLLANASDALEEREAAITVRTFAVEADATLLAGNCTGEQMRPGPYVALAVIDEGAGMPPEVRSHLFEPFFTTKHAGHGLGLAAVLGITRAHKGAILVETAPRRGSTFQVLLPATAAPPQGRAPRAASPVATDAGRLLLVDDDESVLRAMERILRHAGFSTESARDGLEALAIASLQPQRFQAAIIDLTMPRLDGAGTVRALLDRHARLPILIVSGRENSGDVARLTGDGLVEFLAKPFTRQELLDALGGLLSRSGSSAPA